MSAINSKSNGTRVVTIVSHSLLEILNNDALENKLNLFHENINADLIMERNYLQPDIRQVGNSKNLRLERTFKFLVRALQTHQVDIKMLFYINALEALFSSDSIEISHKVSERISLLLGDDFVSRVFIYEKIKKSYSIRSKIVHGAPLSDSDVDLISRSEFLDSLLRKIFSDHVDFFENKNQNQLQESFEALLFER